jgi:hypothetical protein
MDLASHQSDRKPLFCFIKYLACQLETFVPALVKNVVCKTHRPINRSVTSSTLPSQKPDTNSQPTAWRYLKIFTTEDPLARILRPILPLSIQLCSTGHASYHQSKPTGMCLLFQTSPCKQDSFHPLLSLPLTSQTDHPPHRIPPPLPRPNFQLPEFQSHPAHSRHDPQNRHYHLAGINIQHLPQRHRRGAAKSAAPDCTSSILGGNLEIWC